MIRERLWEFRDWLENGADPEAALLLLWISEFEAEANTDEGEYRAFKAFVASRREQPVSSGLNRPRDSALAL